MHRRLRQWNSFHIYTSHEYHCYQSTSNRHQGAEPYIISSNCSPIYVLTIENSTIFKIPNTSTEYYLLTCITTGLTNILIITKDENSYQTEARNPTSGKGLRSLLKWEPNTPQFSRLLNPYEPPATCVMYGNELTVKPALNSSSPRRGTPCC